MKKPKYHENGAIPEDTSVKKILFFAISVLILTLMRLIFSEMRTVSDPDRLIFRKETILSRIPTVEKYYLYDKDGNRYKVSKEIYDGYRLWSEEKRIYANDRVARAIKDADEKREEEAEKAEEKERDVDTAKLLVRNGLNYSKEGDYDQAIINSTNAIKIRPEYAEAYALRAIAYSYKDDYDKCRADINKAQELGYRFNPEFLENLKKTEQG